MVGIDDGQIVLAGLKTNHHAAVSVAYAALVESLAHERTACCNHLLPELHLTFLYIRVLTDEFHLQRLTESGQLAVVANHLKAVAGEDDVIAAGYVNAPMSAQDAAHVDCKTAGCAQVTEPLTGPRRVFGHVELGYMDMPVEQMALIERATTAMNLCLDVARTEVLDEQPLQLYAAFLEPARSRNGRKAC